MNYTLLTSLEHSKTIYTLKGHEVFMMSTGVYIALSERKVEIIWV